MIFLSLMLIVPNLSANEWESNWITALEHCHDGNYETAEQLFTSSIHLMENAGEQRHPSIYVDRADLYLHTDKYEDVLADVSKALASNHLKHRERVKAVSTRVAALLNLQLYDGIKEDIEFLAANVEVQIENAEDHVIIRHMPNNRAFKESMVNYFIHAGLCNSEEDFNMISPEICIVKKAPYKDDITEKISHVCPASSNKQLANLTLQSCRNWCDDNALSAISWCANYPTLCLINACNSAVFEIQTNCRNCCLNGFSQDVCAVPFGDIVAYMQKYLPPCGGCRAIMLNVEGSQPANKK